MNVLIAEKEMVVSLDLKLFLKRNNFRISSIVSCGEDLISDYKMQKPDLMIIDFDLKGVNAMKEIRKTNYPQIIFFPVFINRSLKNFVICFPSVLY